jgi:hypothetical protein
LTNISVIVIAYADDIRYFQDFTLNITLGQISEINRIVSKEYSKTAGSRKPSIAFITLRADEFVSHGHDKVAFPVIFKVKQT